MPIDFHIVNDIIRNYEEGVSISSLSMNSELMFGRYISYADIVHELSNRNIITSDQSFQLFDDYWNSSDWGREAEMVREGRLTRDGIGLGEVDEAIGDLGEVDEGNEFVQDSVLDRSSITELLEYYYVDGKMGAEEIAAKSMEIFGRRFSVYEITTLLHDNNFISVEEWGALSISPIRSAQDEWQRDVDNQIVDALIRVIGANNG